MAGIPLDEDEVDEFGKLVEPTVLFNLETGEGNRILLWIWYTGTATDTMASGELHDD
ncbi:hypothetical protein MSAN_02029400 [Mycena sanguinolenta]|uniref:Uncharacterized protein n=1 Tax=Mycena sanguinolenta TaxID=230812 RepID=A0A8H7CM28_9AGAR|nr:hypothetical protein MSAN_02029400 [Mycena sanguinolenta]